MKQVDTLYLWTARQYNFTMGLEFATFISLIRAQKQFEVWWWFASHGTYCIIIPPTTVHRMK